MKNLIKKISIFCLCLLLVLSMTACAKKGTLQRPLPLIEDFNAKKMDSFVAAQMNSLNSNGIRSINALLFMIKLKVLIGRAFQENLWNLN